MGRVSLSPAFAMEIAMFALDRNTPRIICDIAESCADDAHALTESVHRLLGTSGQEGDDTVRSVIQRCGQFQKCSNCGEPFREKPPLPTAIPTFLHAKVVRSYVCECEECAPPRREAEKSVRKRRRTEVDEEDRPVRRPYRHAKSSTSSSRSSPLRRGAGISS